MYIRNACVRGKNMGYVKEDAFFLDYVHRIFRKCLVINDLHFCLYRGNLEIIVIHRGIC